MLASNIEIYPGELVYSYMGRLYCYYPFFATQQDFSKFIQGKNAKANMQFPKLKILADHSRGFLTYEELLKEHTNFNFFAPFKSRKYNQALLHPELQEKFARFAYLIENPFTVKRARYCPVCARHDIEKYGETYWHREHFLEGIDRCILHPDVLLKEYIPEHGRIKDFSFFRPETEKLELEPDRKPASPQLLKLMTWAGKLLETDTQDYSLEISTEKMKVLLREKGYSNPCKKDEGKSERFNYSALYNSLASYYGEDFIERVGLKKGRDGENPYRKLINVVRGNSKHPIQWITLLSFMTDSPEDFFRTETTIRKRTEEKKGDKHIWVCRNKICDGFNQPVAAEDNLGVNRHGKRVIRCRKCGQIYSVDPDDPSAQIHLLQIGAQFGDKLFELKKKGFTNLQIAEELGTTINVVTYRLKPKFLNNYTPIDDKIKKHRQTLLDWSKEEDSEDVPFFRKFKTLLEYLRFYDSEWLDEFYARTDTALIIDNDAREAEICTGIKKRYNKLIKIEPPIRITQKHLFSGIHGASGGNIKRYPKAKKLAEQLRESEADFRKRLKEYKDKQ